MVELTSSLTDIVSALDSGSVGATELLDAHLDRIERLDGDINAVITPHGASRDLWQAMMQAGPFGAGNSEPRIACPAVRLVKADVVGQNHVRCILSGREGGRLKAIAFRAMDGALGPALLASGGQPMHIAGHLRPDDWQGREGVQLVIDDAAFSI